MTPVARFHLRSAPIYAVIAMVGGLAMGISNDFRLVSAHSHLLLLGWVSTFLAGLFLMVRPVPAGARLPFFHAIAAHIGLIVLVAGVAGINLKLPAGEPLTAIGSVVTVLGMLMFMALVFGATSEASARRPLAVR